MLKLRSFASTTKCKEWAGKVLSLSSHWIQRLNDTDFYTLGAASYLDAPQSNHSYTEKSQLLNPLLYENFSDLYSYTINCLQSALNEPVKIEKKLALPGFHIFGKVPGQEQLSMTKTMANYGGTIHIDRQFEHHTRVWNQYQNYDFLSAISFTGALALPSKGGGLYYWPDGLTENTCAQKYRRSQDYTVGSMIIFDSFFPHKIAPTRSIINDDYRITLQGHGLFCDGSWRIYF